MSHRLEGVLALARLYQLPQWAYSSLPELHPYVLASLGYRPVTRGTIECHICLKRVALTEELLSAPQAIWGILKQHEQNCVYLNEEAQPLSKEELYLAIDDITAEMELSKTAPSAYPLLDTKSLLVFAGPNVFLFRKVLALYDMSVQDFKITFLLKIFGWYLAKKEESDVVTCHFCGRSRIINGLKTTAADRQIQVESQSEGSQQLAQFNPAGQHRYFCTMAQEGWVVFLQHFEDKFAEACSFKFKPLESERIRLRIDKFIDAAKEKIEGGLAKLRTLTHQTGLLCGQLGEDKNLGAEPEEQEQDLKRFRDHEHSLQMLSETIGKQLNHPLKKIRFN